MKVPQSDAGIITSGLRKPWIVLDELIAPLRGTASKPLPGRCTDVNRTKTVRATNLLHVLKTSVP